MYNEFVEITQITNADTLRQMLAQCEDKIMQLAKDEGNCYYWPRETEDLVREELSTRAYILNHMFALHCTPAEVNRFEEVNNALLKLEKVFIIGTISFKAKFLSSVDLTENHSNWIPI